jgi:hypothetical protein
MRCDRLVIHTFGVECIALSMLWMMWLIGASIATVRNLYFLREPYSDGRNGKRTQTFWGNLGWCHEYSPCRLLSALVAFAWIGWIPLLALLGITLAHTFVNRAWTDPMHGHLYPRDSFVPAQEYDYRQSRY